MPYQRLCFQYKDETKISRVNVLQSRTWSDLVIPKDPKERNKWDAMYISHNGKTTGTAKQWKIYARIASKMLVNRINKRKPGTGDFYFLILFPLLRNKDYSPGEVRGLIRPFLSSEPTLHNHKYTAFSFKKFENVKKLCCSDRYIYMFTCKLAELRMAETDCYYKYHYQLMNEIYFEYCFLARTRYFKKHSALLYKILRILQKRHTTTRTYFVPNFKVMRKYLRKQLYYPNFNNNLPRFNQSEGLWMLSRDAERALSCSLIPRANNKFTR